MTQVIWLSDLHFTVAGQVMGHDPRIRVDAAVDHINALHSAADYCVISGDLVDDASAKDYEALALALSRLKIPVLPMLGNHDDRALMRAAFEFPQNVMPDFVQFTCDLGDQLLIALDTLDEGTDCGLLCDARLAWLDEVIAAAGQKPLRIFMHHPPMQLALSMMDQLGLRHADRFWATVARAKGHVSVHAGHVHRAILAQRGAVPVFTLPALIYNAHPERPAWTWEDFSPPSEAPHYGILTFQGEDMVMHLDQICDAGLGVAQ